MSRNSWLASASITTLALVTAMPAASAECGSGAAITVNLLWPTQPATLDSNYDTLVDFAQISRNLYDGLFRFDDAMRLQPSLATDYTQPDDVTYDIKLRDDVTFHDGSPFTAADVVSTFDRISNDAELKSKQRSYVSNVASVTAAGDHEVRIVLKQPDASFLKALASIIFITPKSVIEAVGNVEFGKNPVGSGPFVLGSWVEGDSIVLKANCDYWGEAPIPSQVEFRFIAEPATQISSLQSGEIDIATKVAPDLAAALEGSSDVGVEATNGNQTFYMSMNTFEGAFADERVRRALNLAIDKQAITDQLLGGFGTPVGQIYSSTVFGYSPGIEPYPYDPEGAKALLAEAGIGDGVAIEFVNYRQELGPVWQSIAAYLTEVGFDVTTRYDPNFFTDTWQAGTMGPNVLSIRSNNNLLMDADFALGLELDGARRGLYFKTPETDDAIATARATADEGARQAAYDQLNADLHGIAPVVVLYRTDAIYGVGKQIDWKPRPDGAIYLAGVTKTP